MILGHGFIGNGYLMYSMPSMSVGDSRGEVGDAFAEWYESRHDYAEWAEGCGGIDEEEVNEP